MPTAKQTNNKNDNDMGTLSDLVPVTQASIGGKLVPTANARELHAYLQVNWDFFKLDQSSDREVLLRRE